MTPTAPLDIVPIFFQLILSMLHKFEFLNANTSNRASVPNGARNIDK